MNELQERYEQAIPDLQQFEEYRKRKRQRLKINIILFFTILVIGIALMIVFQDSNRVIFFGALIIMILNTLRHLYDYGITTTNYRTYFKDNIYAKLVPAFLPGVTFDTDSKPAEEGIKASSLFWQSPPSGFDVDTHFSGKVDDMTFEISSYLTDGDSISGVYMNASTNDSVDLVHIGPQAGALGNAIMQLPGAAKLGPNIPRRGLGDGVFDRIYMMHAKSAEEPEAVLTESRVEALLKLRQEFSAWVMVSFRQNKVHVFIQNEGIKHTLSLKQSLLDVANVQAAFEDVTKFLRILKTLR